MAVIRKKQDGREGVTLSPRQKVTELRRRTRAPGLGRCVVLLQWPIVCGSLEAVVGWMTHGT